MKTKGQKINKVSSLVKDLKVQNQELGLEVRLDCEGLEVEGAGAGLGRKVVAFSLN